MLNRVKEVVGNFGAFTALKLDGSVVTWGDSDHGSDSSLVSDQLMDVESISATDFSFVAVKSNGLVVTWGAPLSWRFCPRRFWA
jgi:alpha-tubulin suppressor-like RCC1 family protein